MQRHGDERLGLHLGALDDGDDRVLVGALDVARAAVGDDPAGDALGDRERVGHHLVGVGAEREDRDEHLRRAVDLVDRELVVVEQLAEVVRDPAERVGERVRGEDARGSVDQRLQRGGVGMTGCPSVRPSSCVSSAARPILKPGSGTASYPGRA